MLRNITMSVIALLALTLFIGCSDGSSSGIDNTMSSVETAGINGVSAGNMWMTPARMAEELGLSEEQQAAMKAIHEKYAAQRKERWESIGKTTSREERRAAMKEFHEQIKAEVDAVLTEDQKTKLEQIRAGQFKKMKTRFSKSDFDHAERFSKHIEHLAGKLNLTVEQQESLKTAMTAVHEQFQGQSDNRFDPDAMADLRDKMHEAITSVLTEEQLGKFEQMIAKRGDHFRRPGPPPSMN